MVFSSHNRLYEIFRKYQPKNGLYSIYGNFGVGKTTLALQLSLFSVLKENDVIYFYTKPNFPYNKLFKTTQTHEILDINFLTSHLNLLLINIFSQLYTSILNLEFIFLNKNEGDIIPKMLVIDSLTDLYRLELNSKDVERNVRLNFQLNQILATLVYLKQNYTLDILIINESSKKTAIGEIKEVQAGGSVMEYWVTRSMKIERTNVINKRKLIIKKINDKTPIEIFSTLTNNGFQLEPHT
jgi:RecA/RadA recombinase